MNSEMFNKILYLFDLKREVANRLMELGYYGNAQEEILNLLGLVRVEYDRGTITKEEREQVSKAIYEFIDEISATKTKHFNELFNSWKEQREQEEEE